MKLPTRDKELTILNLTSDKVEIDGCKVITELAPSSRSRR